MNLILSSVAQLANVGVSQRITRFFNSQYDDQTVFSTVSQRIMIKLLTNENVKSTKILGKLPEDFGHETLTNTQFFT